MTQGYGASLTLRFSFIISATGESGEFNCLYAAGFVEAHLTTHQINKWAIRVQCELVQTGKLLIKQQICNGGKYGRQGAYAPGRQQKGRQNVVR